MELLNQFFVFLSTALLYTVYIKKQEKRVKLNLLHQPTFNLLFLCNKNSSHYTAAKILFGWVSDLVISICYGKK